MATTKVSHAIEMAIFEVIRYFKGIPDQCPECQRSNFSPEEGMNTDCPKIIFERPVCENVVGLRMPPQQTKDQKVR